MENSIKVSIKIIKNKNSLHTEGCVQHGALNNSVYKNLLDQKIGTHNYVGSGGGLGEYIGLSRARPVVFLACILFVFLLKKEERD